MNRAKAILGILWIKRGVFVAADILVVGLSLMLAFWLRFDGVIPPRYLAALAETFGLSIAVKVPVLVLFQLYRFSWRHVGIRELLSVVLACLIGSAGLTTAVYLLRDVIGIAVFPRSVLAIDAALCLIGIGAVRFAGPLSHLVFSTVRRSDLRGRRRVLVIGAGDAGALLVRAMQEDPTSPYLPIGYLDDDRRKLGLRIHGVKVLGPRAQLSRWTAAQRVGTVLVAMPSADPPVIRETVDLAKSAGIRDIKILPNLSQLYSGRVSVAELREVRPEDLLPRAPVRIETNAIEAFLKDGTVLVTGAAGSIGSEICRQVLRFGAARLVAVDFNETGLFYLEAELRQLFPDRAVDVCIADVRDRERVSAVLAEAAPRVVYHAAAYKHVPLMEAFPTEAVRTNVGGTRNVLEEACGAGAEAFVLISTDKAVNPTSVMGATKRVAEMMVRARGEDTPMRCVAVRFGNVLGSRGSVLGTFRSQIERRQPITITHPDMRRYFMVTAEAVHLVLQAGVTGRNGEVLVLDMGEPVRIVDMAKDLIRFYGLEPDRDVPIVITGLRPGEKLFEELLTAEEGTEATSHKLLFSARMEVPDSSWHTERARLEEIARSGDAAATVAALRRLVPQFHSAE